MLQDHERGSREAERHEIAPCLGVLGLTYGEHLLVWTLRRLVARRGSCPLIAREFTEVFGEDGEETLSIHDLGFSPMAAGNSCSSAPGTPIRIVS